MGLSASQARMLQLTARRSDIEYQMQQIASARLDLTNQMTEISDNYNNALNDRILYYQESGINSSKNKVQLTHMHLIQQGYEVRDTTTGEVVKPILNVNLTDRFEQQYSSKCSRQCNKPDSSLYSRRK